MSIIHTIAENLTDWMSKSEFDTIQKVADRSKVGFGTVRRIKNADGNPTIKNLADIAKIFGRTPEDLIRPAQGATGTPTSYTLPSNVTELAAQQETRTVLDEIIGIAKKLSPEGQYVLLGRAEELALRYPKAKANPRS